MNYVYLKAVLIAAVGCYLFWPQSDEEAIEREAIERPALRKRSVRPIESKSNHINIALNLIKKYEGFSDVPYLCAAGVLTIGYGETDPAIVSRGYISKEDAHNLLKEKVVMISKDIDKKVYLDLNAHQRAALISFYYNLGGDNFKNIASRINKGNIEEASDAILLYDKCKGRTLKGLKIRRQEEQYLFTL